MRKLTFITTIIGIIAATSAHAGDIDNMKAFGKLHGYATPFQQNEVVANSGQHADVGAFGRISGYAGDINKRWNISKGQYAHAGQFGRLSGYDRSGFVNSEEKVIAKR